MKILLTTLLIVSSLSSFAQEYLELQDHEAMNLVYTDPERGLFVCQQNQRFLYQRYLESTRSQLGHLLEVIASNWDKKNLYRNSAYMKLLSEKVFHYIQIDQMNKLMKKKSLYGLYQPASMNVQKIVMHSEHVNIDLGEEIDKTFSKVLSLHRLQENVVEHIKEELLKETLQDILKGTFKAIISGAAKKTITQILTGAVTQEAFKKALLSTGLEMSSHILMGVAKSSLLSALTLPLQSYRLADEDVWLNLVEKAPLLLLNPEWKNPDSNGLKAARAWGIHCRAMNWKPEEVESHFNKLIKRTEKNFYMSVEVITTSFDFGNPKSQFAPALRDGTYSRPKYVGEKF